jgi:hypothetical protein
MPLGHAAIQGNQVSEHSIYFGEKDCPEPGRAKSHFCLLADAINVSKAECKKTAFPVVTSRWHSRNPVRPQNS